MLARFYDWMVVGKVLREFGAVEKKSGLEKQRVALLLVQRRKRTKFVLKASQFWLIFGTALYAEVPANAISDLRRWLGEAEALLAETAAG